eukprot:4962483-Pleurochrysis_carterae.AAC.1
MRRHFSTSWVSVWSVCAVSERACALLELAFAGAGGFGPGCGSTPCSRRGTTKGGPAFGDGAAGLRGVRTTRAVSPGRGLEGVSAG